LTHQKKRRTYSFEILKKNNNGYLSSLKSKTWNVNEKIKIRSKEKVPEDRDEMNNQFVVWVV
jgi:hypothetical protein